MRLEKLFSPAAQAAASRVVASVALSTLLLMPAAGPLPSPTALPAVADGDVRVASSPHTRAQNCASRASVATSWPKSHRIG